LSYGHSGIQLQTVERLIAFYNEYFPCNLWTRFTRASDLAPLAHLSLGEGEVYFEGKCIRVLFWNNLIGNRLFYNQKKDWLYWTEHNLWVLMDPYFNESK
jgi:hypothetical protein